MSMSSTSTITNISSTQRTTTNNHINNHHHTHRISNGAQACAACKYQRRKCAPDCILAPYFPHDRQKQFLNAHKLFGVSNITKIIRNLKPPEKDMAMSTIIYQSDVRAKDPVGGCYRIVQRLRSDIYYASQQLEFTLQQIAICRAHQAAYQQQQQQQQPQPHHQTNDDPTTTSGFEILPEFNDHQHFQIMPMQDNQEYFNAHQQQQQHQGEIINPQQLHENEDDVGGGEVLNQHHPQQDHVIQDFQFPWNLQDSAWVPSKGSSNREGSSPVEGDDDLCRDVKPLTDHGVNLGHEYVEITSFERGESFKFDQQANEKSDMILKAENLALDDEAEAFQQHQISEHQIPEHDLRSAATLFSLTS